MPVTSQRNAEDERATLFPPELLPLFGDAFILSCDLLEEYVASLTLAVFRSTGLEAVFRMNAGVTLEQVLAQAGLAASVARVPVAWILAMLTRRGWLESGVEANGEILHRLEQPLPELDPNEILQRQQGHDPRYVPSFAITTLAAEYYPAILRGQMTGEQALFSAEGISAWVKYFSNDNPLYAVSNALGAIAAEQSLPEGPVSILEIGGGLGSGTEALLDRFKARTKPIAAYHFTEISALFLKRARRSLLARWADCPLSFAPLDIDRPFAEGDIAPATYSLVYGVNVLHVARDLAATLCELRSALKVGGVMVMSECVRPFADTPLHMEFVFNLLTAFRDPLLVPTWRPNGGFLTPEQWTSALIANGFKGVRIYPDIAAIRGAYPSFVAAAIVARKT